MLLSVRLFSAFIEDVAGYIEMKRETRWRQQCGRWIKSRQSNGKCMISVLMTDLGLTLSRSQASARGRFVSSQGVWQWFILFLFINV